MADSRRRDSRWTDFVTLQVFRFLDAKEIARGMSISKYFKNCLPRAMNALEFDRPSKLKCEEFVTALAAGRLPALRRLSIRGVNLGDAGVEKLLECLSRGGTRLQTLRLYAVGISPVGVAAVSQLLCNGLECLDLWANNTGAEGAVAVANALRDSKTARFIRLEGNGIGDAGAKALAEALPASGQLRVLNIGANDIGDVGAAAIARAMNHAPNLRMIDFSANLSRTAGAQAFASALRTNTNLVKLNLSYNDIDAAGAEALLAATSSNQTLKWMDLGGNHVAELAANAPLVSILRQHSVIIIQDEDMPNDYLQNMASSASSQQHRA